MAGLVVIGEPTIEKAFDKVVQGATKVVKRSLDATTDEIASELQEAPRVRACLKPGRGRNR